MYWSEDDGATWTLVDGGVVDASPTVMVATDNGIVCGSDSDPGGIYGIARQSTTGRLKMELVWRWWAARDGVVGFAQRGFRDPRSGLVYIGFSSGFSDVKMMIAAGTATSAGMVWQASSAGAYRVYNLIVTDTGKLIGYNDDGGTNSIITANVSTGGLIDRDTGNVLGGISASASSIAVGAGAALTSGASSAVSVGVLASAAGQGVAVGKSASVSVAGGVAVGYTAQATNTKSIAIGFDAQATSAQNNVTIGEGSRVTSNGGVTLGAESITSHALSVALGAVVSTTANSQVAVGTKHFELLELAADAAAGAANSARLYVRDNGSGKTQLVVRFATGAIQVIATEP